MNFQVIETSVLKLGNKSEAFLVSLENKTDNPRKSSRNGTR